MQSNFVPQFAVVGHPNEGKSSVLSTLAEDDSVRVSSIPGETTVCQEFPVKIDRKEVIRFIDTPGFQNPTKVLKQLKDLQKSTDDPIGKFRENNQNNFDYKEDCELLSPLTQRSGIIYVVDGSRPVRNVDKAEMEILRITGLPRMAIINAKEEDESFLEQWKIEFRKCFNTFRVFNAHHANYAQRIQLLNSLRNIDEDWEEALQTVIQAFKDDWKHRNALCVEIITEMVKNCLAYKERKNISSSTDVDEVKESLQKHYAAGIKELESMAYQQIRGLFKHNIFNYELPSQSILQEDLFSEKTWKLLGLNRKQLIATACAGGAGVGAAIDVAAAGITFGVFSAIGGVAGIGSMVFGGKKLARAKVLGLKLGGEEIQIGPCKNVQFLYILLDRCLIYYSFISNWAHGCRDYHEPAGSDQAKKSERSGYTDKWSAGDRKKCMEFFDSIQKGSSTKRDEILKQLTGILLAELNVINKSETLTS